jgi:hypothetical protein
MANINIEIIHIAVKQIVNWKCAPPAYPSRRLVSARTHPDRNSIRKHWMKCRKIRDVRRLGLGDQAISKEQVNHALFLTCFGFLGDAFH